MEALRAAVAVSNPETFRSLESEDFDTSRPRPVAHTVEVDGPNADWATFHGYQHIPYSREGAEFLRLAQDVFVIPVRGAQPLHHDRHLADMADQAGFSEHTWNLVVEGCPDQMLVLEVEQDVFEHFPLQAGELIYFNTVNRHMVTRKDPMNVSIIVQVDGFGPNDGLAALARINEVLASRPRAFQVGFEAR
jgi:hypothetical protein